MPSTSVSWRWQPSVLGTWHQVSWTKGPEFYNRKKIYYFTFFDSSFLSVGLIQTKWFAEYLKIIKLEISALTTNTTNINNFLFRARPSGIIIRVFITIIIECYLVLMLFRMKIFMFGLKINENCVPILLQRQLFVVEMLNLFIVKIHDAYFGSSLS